MTDNAVRDEAIESAQTGLVEEPLLHVVEPLQPSAPSVGIGFQLVAFALAAAHLSFAWQTSRLRWEHVAADALLALLPWLGKQGRAFTLAALPVWLTGVVYDNHGFFAALHGPLEVNLAVAARNFWVTAPGGLNWPEWFHLNPKPVLDLMAGFAYSTHLLELGLIGIFLFFFGRRDRFRALAWSFLFANVLGMVVTMAYPAAPPWYVISHGLGPVDPSAASSAGGAARVDALLGITYFQHFYARNPFVWGAVASLHSAYPVLAAFAVWDRGWRWRIPTAAYAMLMWFSAVYLAHHYFLDVVIGVTIAVSSALLAQRGMPRLAAYWRTRGESSTLPSTEPAIEP
ncbi:MAG: phosphatase PAP2 family protein [Deltaproteobacteria bacterium]|nr:phosphatase PAP2 family protein [Deltaproteobacteria bacterium]